MNVNNFSFTGIESIVYGVEDMNQCKQFCLDWGLSLVSSANDKFIFETKDGGEVIVVPTDQSGLPEAFESGSTLRRVIWGVKNDDDLTNLRKTLLTDESFKEELEGPSVTDPNGMRLTFRVNERKPITSKGLPVNVEGHTSRIDQRSRVYNKAEPLKIGHVVFFATDVIETVAFYKKLGFLVSDCYPGTGYFMRCREVGGHHDLFLLQTPDHKRGLNHVAYTVHDIEEVFGGGTHINSQGWKTQIGPGRHPVSSAYFWYVHNPCGGLAEYYTNEDFCTEKWESKEWKRSNENFAEWAITNGIDPKTRRQMEVK